MVVQLNVLDWNPTTFEGNWSSKGEKKSGAGECKTINVSKLVKLVGWVVSRGKNDEGLAWVGQLEKERCSGFHKLDVAGSNLISVKTQHYGVDT